MSLPATLYGNYIAVTGSKTTQSLIASGGSLQFGLVVSGNENLATGASILFKMGQDTIRLNSGSSNYFLISEADIVLIENPVSS